MASPTGKGLLGPDGLAMRGLAGPPALGEPGDKEQAASTFVEGACPAEVRGGAAAVGDLADERPVPDETELDRALSVPDRVGYKFADHKPHDERRIVKTPPRGVVSPKAWIGPDTRNSQRSDFL